MPRMTEEEKSKNIHQINERGSRKIQGVQKAVLQFQKVYFTAFTVSVTLKQDPP
jgi:hypothetical protein